MNTLRKKIYNFLWGSDDLGKKFHLCNWESLVKSVLYGGWDIKNLQDFGMSLWMKSLWMVLTGKGMWHDVIMSKYCSNWAISTWVRNSQLYNRGTSLTWNTFLKVYHWISRSLSWKVGSGEDIRLGIDPIVGLEVQF